jgi:hypothetical protein
VHTTDPGAGEDVRPWGTAARSRKRARARELRAQAWTLREIADELGVARSSVSVWVRDVAFDPDRRRSRATGRRPRGPDHPLRQRKLAQLERLAEEGRERIGTLTDRDLLLAGLGLYAGDGGKGDKEVHFANSNPDLVRLFCRWLRTFFAVDESRLRVSLYLHQGLDLEAATTRWSEVTAVPVGQFRQAYRPVAREGVRHTKHASGCAHVTYGCSQTQRRILALMQALLDAEMVAPGAGLEPATS